MGTVAEELSVVIPFVLLKIVWVLLILFSLLVQQVEINEPYGWVWIKLRDHSKNKPIRTFMVQISVLQVNS